MCSSASSSPHSPSQLSTGNTHSGRLLQAINVQARLDPQGKQVPVRVSRSTHSGEGYSLVPWAQHLGNGGALGANSYSRTGLWWGRHRVVFPGKRLCLYRHRPQQKWVVLGHSGLRVRAVAVRPGVHSACSSVGCEALSRCQQAVGTQCPGITEGML